jgi:phytoene synthase
MHSDVNNAKLILKTNGKSFYWAGKFLPSAYINRAAELYKFCRTLDDIADNDQASSLDYLNSLRFKLIKNEDLKQTQKHKLTYPKFFNDSSKRAAIHLVDGLIADQETVLFQEEEDLIRYSYQVAGTVGIMMCDALECYNENAKSFAIDLGIAMQLTNIARDVLEDAKMGRRYLPGCWVDQISPQEIIRATEDKNLKTIKNISKGIQNLLSLAEKYYYSGSQGFIFLPMKTRLAISIASQVYRQIGVQLKSKNYNWYEGREVTSKITKMRITISTLLNEILFSSKVEVKHKSELHRLLQGFI